MSGFKKLFFPTSELKNHFLNYFQSSRYQVIDPGLSENFFSISEIYEGKPLYVDEYTSSSSINFKMIIEQYSSNFKYKYPFPEQSLNNCIKLIGAIEKEFTHKEIEQFKKGFLFCKTNNLEEFLKIAFDKFFKKFPTGNIISVRLDPLYFNRISIIRGMYAINNYPDIKENISDFHGFNSLKNWLFIDNQNIFENILLFSEYFFFPFTTAFHCYHGLGLIFIFFPDKPIEYKLDLFPRDIVDYLRSGTEFARESKDELLNENLYAKYCFNQSPSFIESYEFILWAVNCANTLIKELFNICNFSDSKVEEKIDPIYALEYNLSISHLIKISLSILSSNSTYFNKSMTFQSADIYSDLCNYKALGMSEKNFFWRLFNKDEILPVITNIIDSCSFSIKNRVNSLAQDVYNNLNTTVKKSIWIKYKIIDDKIKVRNKKLDGDELNDISTFTSEVIRALRNTHHGYLSRNDTRNNRPSRYLSLIDGNIPDTISTLSLIWLICLLQDRGTFIGNP